jgi:hypothetical protein
LSVVRQANKYSWYNVKVDTAQKTIVLKTRGDTTMAYAKFGYAFHKDTMKLKGYIKSDTAKIVFIRKQKKDYPLIKRGFHWVNEYPYNR